MMMKKIYSLFIILAIITIYSEVSYGVANPEGIWWQAPSDVEYLQTLFPSVMGRQPSAAEWAKLQKLIPKMPSVSFRRFEAFLKLIATPEYKNTQWGKLKREYSIYWKTRNRDTEKGRLLCHCYYFAEFSDGFMPSMQYTGANLPAGRFSFPVARAFVLAYNAYDRESCPHFDCGYNGGGTASHGSRSSFQAGGSGASGGGRTGTPSPGTIRFTNPLFNGIPWDWCLTWAHNCGKPAADDFCRRKGYSSSANHGWRYMNKTLVVGSNKICTGKCGGFTYVDCAKKASGAPAPQTRNYNTCVELICPACKKSVHLLERAVTAECQQCIDRNRDKINQCMQGNTRSNPHSSTSPQINSNTQRSSNAPAATHQQPSNTRRPQINSNPQRGSNAPAATHQQPSNTRRPQINCRKVCVKEKVKWHNVSDGRHSLCANGIPKAPGPGLRPPKCEKSVTCLKWKTICK